jgi:hypothetical protein
MVATSLKSRIFESLCRLIPSGTLLLLILHPLPRFVHGTGCVCARLFGWFPPSLPITERPSRRRYQTFRYPDRGNDRIRTQVLIKGVAVKDRQIVEPRRVLAGMGTVDDEMIDRLLIRPTTTNAAAATSSSSSESTVVEDMFFHFEELDGAFRASANFDDNTLLPGKGDDDEDDPIRDEGGEKRK